MGYDFSMTVHTNRSGRYERTYFIGGTLRVTPMTPTSPAQVLLGDPRQSLAWRFAAGDHDHFARHFLCDTP